MPKVSVVVCAKNEEKDIEQCLRLLSVQKPLPEIIIVDGHSTDSTVEIAKKYADKVVFDNKAGLADARNVGWKAASGDIVAYCDADSHPEQGWVAAIIKNMEDAICVSGPIISYDGGWYRKLSLKLWGDIAPRIAAKIRYNNVWGANMAFRRDTLEKEPFRARFLEDFEIGHRLRKIGKVKFTKEMSLPISSRRFAKGFYRICLRYYIPATLKILLFKDYEQRGYY
jgi:glycosyltransferase involved in cell wall biosynthesis